MSSAVIGPRGASRPSAYPQSRTSTTYCARLRPDRLLGRAELHRDTEDPACDAAWWNQSSSTVQTPLPELKMSSTKSPPERTMVSQCGMEERERASGRG